jgi:hypothetical protein
MDLRLVVGGLLTRDAVLSALLLNYADRLERGPVEPCAGTTARFIVPCWAADERPSAPPRGRLLRVEAHASPADPGRHENLDAILRRLDAVLTDDQAGRSIRARRLLGSADLRSSPFGTVVRVGVWAVAPAPSRDGDSSAPGSATRAPRRPRTPATPAGSRALAP